jgi:gliding motility-associated-like protein
MMLCILAIGNQHFIQAQSASINLNPVSPTVICNDGSNEFKFSVSGQNLPAGANIAVYQSRDTLFNPYNQEGTLIGIVPGDLTGSTDTNLFKNCVRTIGIFIDACGEAGLESRNEYMVLTSGKGFAVNDLTVDFAPQNNGGNVNADINIGNGCTLKAPEQSLIQQLRNGSCNANNIIPVAPGSSVPANSIVVLFTSSNVSYNYDLSGLCNKGLPIYILQNACERTLGGFTNSPSCASDPGTRYRNTVVGDKAKGCVDNYVYDRCGLFDLNGTYTIRQNGFDTASVDNKGIVRNELDTCGGIDFTKLNFKKDTVLTINVPESLCNLNDTYIKAIIQTQNQQEQSISNTISYKLVCQDVNATVENNTICSGETTSIKIKADLEGSGLSWTVLANANISGASAGTGNTIEQSLVLNSGGLDSVTYYVVANKNGCTDIDTIIIRVELCDFITDTVSICKGDSIEITAPETAENYNWSPSETLSNPGIENPIAKPEQTTLYEVRDGQSALLGKVLVEVRPLPAVTLPANSSICEGGQTILDAGAQGATYLWSTTDTTQTITVSEVGQYSVTVTQNNCTITASTVVALGTAPTVSLGDDLSFCGQFSTTLGTGVSNTLWSTGVIAASITVSQPGIYWAEIANDCGTARDTIEIIGFQNPSIDLGEDKTLCDGEITLSIQGQGENQIQWSNGASGNSIIVTEPGIYSVKVTNENGCSDSDTITVFSCCEIKDMPTAFTPNGDLKNDLYIVRTQGIQFEKVTLSIYNRWGEKVFETNDLKEGWNGVYKSEPAPAGVYGYLLEAECVGGESITKKGNLTLIR